MGRAQKNREDSHLRQMGLAFEREHESAQERNQRATEPNTRQDPVNHFLSGHLLLVIQEEQLPLSSLWDVVGVKGELQGAWGAS